MKLLVIGGDKRYCYLADMLAKGGHSVRHYFKDNSHWSHRDIEILECEGIILPIPISKNGVDLNCPGASSPIKLADFFSAVAHVPIVIGGVVSGEVAEIARLHNMKIHDVMEWEELTIRNAIATAEGAVCLAMEQTEKTIFGENCLVVGYGRIGKILAKFLKGLGACVTVATRKSENISWIKVEGYDSISLRELAGRVGEFGLVFNTAPALVIDRDVIKNIMDDGLVIDLASAPGGVDFVLAEKMGVRVIQALGLPGKIAPYSAGQYIADTVEDFLIEETNLQIDRIL